MTIQFSAASERDYQDIPNHIHKKFKKQLKMLAHYGVTHRGLGARKMTNRSAIWEARIDIHYRFTFQMNGEVVLIRRIGTHEIYRSP